VRPIGRHALMQFGQPFSIRMRKRRIIIGFVVAVLVIFIVGVLVQVLRAQAQHQACFHFVLREVAREIQGLDDESCKRLILTRLKQRFDSIGTCRMERPRRTTVSVFSGDVL
jgi:hypothetical protein